MPPGQVAAVFKSIGEIQRGLLARGKVIVRAFYFYNNKVASLFHDCDCIFAIVE